MFGTLSLSSGFQRAWFFFHDTYSLSGRLRPAPLYTWYYPWQSSHGPSISACWDLHCNLGFTNGLLASLQRFWPCYMVLTLSFSPWTPSVLRSHLQLMSHHQQWLLSSLCSGRLQCCHSCSTWPLREFKTGTIWEILTHYQVQLPTGEAALAPWEPFI